MSAMQMAAIAADTVDTGKSEAFATRMGDAANRSAFVLMTSIGHRTGLFDVMAKMGPSGSGEAGFTPITVRRLPHNRVGVRGSRNGGVGIVQDRVMKRDQSIVFDRLRTPRARMGAQ